MMKKKALHQKKDMLSVQKTTLAELKQTSSGFYQLIRNKL